MPQLVLGSLGGLTGRLVTLVLVHSLWIGLLAASAAAIALTFIPHRRRDAQYGLLLAALGLVAVGPPIATALQRFRADSGQLSPVGTIDIIQGKAAPNPEEAGVAATPSPLRPPLGMEPHAWHESIVTRMVTAFDSLQPIVLAIWILAAIPMLVLVAIGLFASGARRRRARPAPAAIQERSDRLARRIGLRRATPVLVHPAISEPCLCGLIRPAVLLPGRWLPGAGDDRIDAVLAHELAHERRLDLPVNLLQRLVEAVFFFHPAVIRLSRSLRDRRERCADAMAVAITGDPLALAEALESVARLRPTARRVMPLDASLGGDDLSLLSRVQELLGMMPARHPARLRYFVSLPATAFVALLSAHLSLAQDRTPPLPADVPGPGVVSAKDHALDVRADYDKPADWHRQISYEVRFIESEANKWRRGIVDRLRPVEGEAGGSAWILDPDDKGEVMNLVYSDTAAGITQAPKVTAYEGTSATITNMQKLQFIGDVKPVKSPDSVAFVPEIKSLSLGAAVDLSGTIRPGATDITVELSDKALLAFHGFYREAESTRGRIRASYQVPTTTESRNRFSCTIPDGATLMVSLGVHERPGRLSGVTGVAVALLEVAGTRLKARGETVERFVLITPCPMIVKDE